MKKALLLLFVGFVSHIQSQTTIGMSQIVPPDLNDTVTAGSTENYTVWVKNLGVNPFADTIILHTAVFDTASTGFNLVGVYNSNGIVNIAPNDSAQFLMTAIYNLSPIGYTAGIDIIVIWPVAQDGTTTADSLFFNIYIIAPVGINNLDINKSLKMFPSPTKEKLTLELMNNSKIKAVLLFDINGKIIPMQLNENTINVEHLTKGMYSIDIELENKSHITGKFIKQ